MSNKLKDRINLNIFHCHLSEGFDTLYEYTDGGGYVYLDFINSKLNDEGLSLVEIDYLDGLFSDYIKVYKNVTHNMYDIKIGGDIIRVIKCYDEWYYIFYRNEFSYVTFFIKCDGFVGVKDLFSDLMGSCKRFSPR